MKKIFLLLDGRAQDPTLASAADIQHHFRILWIYWYDLLLVTQSCTKHHLALVFSNSSVINNSVKIDLQVTLTLPCLLFKEQQETYYIISGIR